MGLIRFILLPLAVFGFAPLAAQEGEAPQRPKRIAITFDDIPRAPGVFLSEDERTKMLIEGLEEAGVAQAAFFLNPGRITKSEGAKRKGAEQRIADYVAAGHVIANHTANHPRLSQVSAADFLADLDAAAAWFEGREGVRPWFRYPYLDEGRADKAKRDAMRAALAERGLANAYVTVDASDWFYEGEAQKAVHAGVPLHLKALGELYIESHVEAAEFYAGLATRATARNPAHVLLLHETDLAALFLVDLIAELRAKGWEIITVDEAYADPIAIEATRYDTPSAGGTLIEQIAWQKGLPSPRWYARNDTKLALKEIRVRVLGEERFLPSAFHGVWDYEGGTCAPESDLRIEVSATEIGFYESFGRITRIRREGDDALVTLAMQGEGETWEQVLRLSLVQEGDTLRLHTSDAAKPKAPDPLPKKKCEVSQ